MKLEKTFFVGSTLLNIFCCFSCCPHPLTDITFTIVLKRKASFHMFNVIVPSLVLTFYALFIFAFPEETGERMGLAMDCFLTISILMMMVSDMMPIDSNVTPLLGAFMLVSMLSITFSICKFSKSNINIFYFSKKIHFFRKVFEIERLLGFLRFFGIFRIFWDFLWDF